ncbi:MAG: CoA-binding protein [Ignavibacteria bacterium]|nr:CoA-binding protein [Ignavibacteria bacterium]
MNNICEILKNSKTIAVVGISDKPGRDSGLIARFLKSKGYIVYGVNPTIKSFDGIQVYKSLKDIPDQIDIVDIFRRSEFVTEIVKEAIEIKAKVVWMQLGVVNYDAEKLALDAGLKVIMDRCIAIEYRMCFG